MADVIEVHSAAETEAAALEALADCVLLELLWPSPIRWQRRFAYISACAFEVNCQVKHDILAALVHEKLEAATP